MVKWSTVKDVHLCLDSGNVLAPAHTLGEPTGALIKEGARCDWSLAQRLSHLFYTYVEFCKKKNR